MRILNIIFFLTFFCDLFSQELPPISVYTSKDYHAENQNWSISQGKDNHVYIANNQGLLEFDGATWSLYPSPNETIVRSVKVKDDKVFIGFFSDFGYWQKNNMGRLEYTSLTNDLDLLDDEQFWGIEEVEDWIVFQSLRRIYLYNLKTKEIKIHQSETQILNICVADNVLYYQEYNKGIYKMLKGKPQLVSKASEIQQNVLVGVHNINEELVFVTDNKGIYTLKEGQLKVWNFELQQKIMPNTVYSTLKLRNGNLVVGTIAHGVFIVNKKGEITDCIDQKKGLTNNTVLSLFEDAEENIWLGLDDGINVIDLDSPLRVYKDLNGVIGTIYTSVVFNDRIYIGTNQGLFSKKSNSTEHFSFVNNTEGQVWTLKIINNELFCGHNSGTFLVNGLEAERFSSVMGVWKMESLSKTEFLQGTYTGLYVVHKVNGSWTLKNKVEGFNISSRYFEIYDDTTIFINHEYKGVYKLSVKKDLSQVTNTQIISSVPKGLHSALVKYKGNILFSYKKGVYKYQARNDEFVKDSLLSNYLSMDKYISGVLVHTEGKEDKLWGFAKKEIVCIEQGGVSLKPIVKTISIPLSLRKGAAGFENICRLSPGNYLLGNSNGYITLNLDNLSHQKEYDVKISQIKKSSINKNFSNIKLDSVYKFSNDENNFEFYCNVPVFDQFKQVEYQYKIDGLSKLWSDWSQENKIDVENLPFGKYTFSVRARVNGVLTKNIATYAFSVKRPWFLSNWLIAGYILSIFLFSVFMHRMYTLRHFKEKQRLLKRKQNELELQKLENDKRLTLLENEKLEADVELKSKELASSTMSVVKKNELLSGIKDELLKGEQKNIQNVIRTIDKNLNNQGDWKLFEEAFNNADKDFIKKIKQIHPSLTSNDLRLCAYLRLNLSSKEIAPLLNISPKSVEVKRYRLRKKMALSNETKLVDYILEL